MQSSNLNRKRANRAAAQAEEWENLAKRLKAEGSYKLAMKAASQARRNRRDERYYREKG